MAPAPGVAYTAPAPVTEYVDHARAVAHEATAPVIEHVATSPATEYGVPVPGVTHTAPSPIVHVAPDSYLDEGKSPKRAKKSSRRKRPHHHDDDDVLLSEATALADHERTLLREEMREPGSLHNSALSAILCLCQIDPDSVSSVAKARKNWHGARHGRRARAVAVSS